MNKTLNSLSLLIAIFTLVGCVTVSYKPQADRPVQNRPAELEQYYSQGRSYTSFTDTITSSTEDYDIHRIELASDFGTTVIDYYRRHNAGKELILVFPILGGGNQIVNYFSEYFSGACFDSAIIHRANDFKDPTKFYQIETIMRDNIIRDRIALDFFEKEYGKKDFGSFGISRGAINVAMTAGVDRRLRYNIMALGATDVPRIMRTSNERRMDKYKKSITDQFKISDEQFFDHLTTTLKTDPKYLARYMDPKDALLFLGALDKTVPIQYGVKLKQTIGDPETIYLLADHYIAIGFTGLAETKLAALKNSPFPARYIEKEALRFFNKRFGREETYWGLLASDTIKAPFNLLANLIDRLS